MKKKKLKLSDAERQAVDEAIKSIAKREALTPEDCFDCRQDITISLLLRADPPENLRDWLRGAALKWALAFEEANRIRKRTEKEYWVKTCKRYKKGPIWEPKWFPPHPDAEEHAPFAVKGARLIKC